MNPKKRRNLEAAVSACGVVLYLLLCVISQKAADILVIPLALISLFVFADIANARSHDKEAVSYSLLWGTGAVALMMGFVAYETARLWLGLI